MNMNEYTVPLSNTATTLDITDTIGRSEMSDIEAYIGYTDEDIAGIEADFENNTFTRLAGAIGKSGGSDFNSFPTYAGMRRCNLSDSGVVNAYYGDNNFIEDGSNGQVMVEIPRFYYKVVPLKLQKQDWADYEATAWVSKKSYALGDVVIYNSVYYTCTTANSDETFTPAKWYEISELGLSGYHILKARYYISATPKDGFKVHPLFVNPTSGELREYAYFSAYSGILYDVSAGAYLLNDEQVANVTASTGDKLSSIGGTYERQIIYYDKTLDENVTVTVNAGAKPCSGVTSSNNLTRHNCTVLAENRGSGWEQQTIEATCAVWLLFMIEYGNCNIQTSIGAGVTSITDNGTGNCGSFIGSTSSLGNTTGNATSTVDYTGTTRTTSGTLSCSYRGIEDFFGNLYKWVEGVNIYGANTNGGGKVYICNDGVYADNKTTDNYKFAGFTLTKKSGWVKYFGYSNEEYDWLFLTSKVGGNSSLPVGDYTYVNANLNGHRVASLGACWYYGASAGLYWFCHYGSSHRSRIISSRCVYLG